MTQCSHSNALREHKRIGTTVTETDDQLTVNNDLAVVCSVCGALHYRV